MYEHAIPQNIMDYEFKLFAGLSMKQFIYVAVSCGMAFGLFMLNRNGALPAFFAWLTIPVILLFGIVMGLGSYRGRPMEDWFTAFFRANRIALRRVWKKDTNAVRAENFFSTKPNVLPTYLAVYFYTQDEFRKIIQSSFVNPAEMPQQSVTQISDPVKIIPSIKINHATVNDYADISIKLPSIPNTFALKLTEDSLPMEGVVAYIKDASSTVITALRSNSDGIIYFNQSFPNGDYTLDLQAQNEATFPKVEISLDGTTYPLINLSPVS